MKINKNNGPPASLADIGYRGRGTPSYLFCIHETHVIRRIEKSRSQILKPDKGSTMP